MARLGVAFAGAAIGFAIGGPLGAAAFGAQLGFAGGLLLGNLLFPGPTVRTSGPRLEERRVQVSTLGLSRPRLHATYEYAGNVLWLENNEIREVSKTEELGGKGGPSQEHTTHTYFATLAVGLGEGPIGGVLKIDGDDKPIADFRSSNTGPQVRYPGCNVRVYLGTEDQLPDPAIQGDVGIEDAPAYRGEAYVVIENLPLADFGNRIPNLTFLAFSEGVGAFPLVTTSGVFDDVPSSQSPVYRGPDGYFYHLSTFQAEVYDPITQDVVYNGAISDPLSIAASGGGGGFGISQDGTILYTKGNSSNVGRLNVVDADSMSTVRTLGVGSLFGDEFDIEGDSAQLITARGSVPKSIIARGASVRSLGSEVLCLIADTDIGGTAKINVFGNGATHPSDGNLDFFVGAARKAKEGEGRWLGWPAIDVDNHVWCVTNDADEVFVYEWEWDLQQNVYPIFDAGGDVAPVVRSKTDVSASIAEFHDGTELVIPCTYYEEEDSIVFLLKNRLYKFSCATKTITGPALSVTAGTAGTSVNATMKSGVGADGTMVFKQDTRFLNRVNVRAWTMETNKYDTAAWGVSGAGGNGAGYVAELNAWLGVSEPNAHLLFLDRQTDEAKPLNLVMEEELALTGIEASRVDMGSLAGDVTRGYLAGYAPASQTVEPLARFHFFDLVETNGKLTAVVRGLASSFAVPADDLGAYPAGTARPVSLLKSREPELKLPLRVEVGYASAARGYERAGQYDKRDDGVVESQDVLAFETAEVFTDDEAHAIARKLLAEIWEGSVEYETSLSVKWLKLDPTDRGTLTTAAGNVLYGRLTQTELTPGYVYRVRARRDRGESYTQVGTGVPTGTTEPTLVFIGSTRLFVVDGPLFRDDDDAFGVYLLGGPKNDDPAWPGARVSDSDDGEAFQSLAQLTAGAAYGFALEALGDQPRWTVVDLDNTLKVRWVNGDPPATVTDTDFMNNAAAYLVGDEVVLARDSVDNGDGTHTLSHLLRARLGTEDKVAGHVIGERVLRLDASTARNVFTSITRLNATRYFRASTFGQTSPSVDVQEFVNTGRRLRPLSPYHVQLVRGGNGDVTVTWERRTRRRFTWEGNLRAPLAETAEEYALDLRHPDTAALLRTVTDLTAKSHVYTKLQQQQDATPDVIGAAPTDVTSQLTNPDFETGDLTGWTATGAGWSASTFDPHTGTWSLRYAANDRHQQFQVVGDVVDLLAAGITGADLDAGIVVFQLKYWRNRDLSAGNGTFVTWTGLRFLDAAQGIISEAQTAQELPPTAYTQRTLVKTAPAGTRFVQVVVYVLDDAFRSYNWDDFTLEWSYPLLPTGLIVDVAQVSPTLKVEDGQGRGIIRRATLAE